MKTSSQRWIIATGFVIALAAAAPTLRGQQPPIPPRPTTAPTDEISPTLALQIRLDRAGFSPGQIDGAAGANTRRAADAFRRARSVTGDDAAVRAALGGDEAELLVPYVITDADAAGPFVPEIPADLMAQATLPALSYMSVQELVAERAHVSPKLLAKLNPGATFAAGDSIRIPNVVRTNAPSAPATGTKAAAAASGRIVVSRAESGLTVYDNENRVVFFAPVTSGSEHDPLPLGKWTVTAIVRNPTFNYNPTLFWDADPTHAKVKLPAGPNGPVGTVWIDLSKPHYGIHGTSEPGNIGHTASHGCVRMTNWDVEMVAGFARKGMPVLFEP